MNIMMKVILNSQWQGSILQFIVNLLRMFHLCFSHGGILHTCLFGKEVPMPVRNSARMTRSYSTMHYESVIYVSPALLPHLVALLFRKGDSAGSKSTQGRSEAQFRGMRWCWPRYRQQGVHVALSRANTHIFTDGTRCVHHKACVCMTVCVSNERLSLSSTFHRLPPEGARE